MAGFSTGGNATCVLDWNVSLGVRLLWFTMIRFRGIWVHCELPMPIHQHFAVDRMTVRK